MAAEPAPTPTFSAASPSPAKSKMGERFKIVFVGNQGVGKTSIINRYLKDSFDDAYNVRFSLRFSKMGGGRKNKSNIGNDRNRCIDKNNKN